LHRHIYLIQLEKMTNPRIEFWIIYKEFIKWLNRYSIMFVPCKCVCVLMFVCVCVCKQNWTYTSNGMSITEHTKVIGRHNEAVLSPRSLCWCSILWFHSGSFSLLNITRSVTNMTILWHYDDDSCFMATFLHRVG